MAEPLARLRRFLRELKRRNVYRVAVTYALVGFVLVQVADLTFVRLGLPPWTVTFVIVLVALGFPLALVLAWAFEMTPEGVRRTPRAERPEEGTEPAEERRSRSRRALQALVALGLLGAAVAGGWYLTGGGGESPEVSERTVAVLPFQVSGSGAEEWRDGMVTMLSTGLDGAAGLRAIADQTVLAAWEGAGEAGASRSTSRSLATARRVGAEYAVVGQAVQLGDELRLAADIHDTRTGDRVGQVEVAGSPEHVTGLADSLTRRVLGVLLEKGEQDLPSVNLASLTTSSLPALKSYLAGERHFRAGEYAAAIEDYRAAIGHDSTFALAYVRLGISRAWGSGDDVPPFLRAYELLDQLPQRERRLVRAQAIWEVWEQSPAAADTLRRLTEAYPDDPSTWYWLAETVFHGSIPGGWPEAEKAFEQAVRLDPGIAPYHHHLVDLAVALHQDSALAARRIEAHPDGPVRSWYRALWDLKFGSAERRQDAWTRIDTLAFGEGWWLAPLQHPRDLALRGRVLEALLQRQDTPDYLHGFRALNWLRRGQLDRVVSRGSEAGDLACLLVMHRTLGYPVPDSVLRARLGGSGAEQDASVERLLCRGLWLIEAGRADELDPVLERLRGLAPRAEPPPGVESRATDAVRGLKGYRAWRAGNLEEAADHWSDFNQDFVTYAAILRGDLYRELGRRERAEAWYVAAWPHPVAHERLGQLYEEMGKPGKAVAAYRRFITAWEDADPALQDRVAAARERLEALQGADGASTGRQRSGGGRARPSRFAAAPGRWRNRTAGHQGSCKEEPHGRGTETAQSLGDDRTWKVSERSRGRRSSCSRVRTASVVPSPARNSTS